MSVPYLLRDGWITEYPKQWETNWIQSGTSPELPILLHGASIVVRV